MYRSNIIRLFLCLVFLLISIVPQSTRAMDYIITEDSTYHVYLSLLYYYENFAEANNDLDRKYYLSSLRTTYSTLEIKNDSLFLLKVEEVIRIPIDENGMGTGSRIVPAECIIVDGKYPIFLDWYSDTLILPKGDKILCEHTGHQRYYVSQENVIFEDGIVRDWVNKRYDNLDKFRSGEDMDWCGVEMPNTNFKDWVDARLLYYLASHNYLDSSTIFKTRAVFPCDGWYDCDAIDHFIIPETPMTEEIIFGIEDELPVCGNGAEPIFVEITGKHIGWDDDLFIFRILDYRILNKNESIHNALFPIYHRMMELE